MKLTTKLGLLTFVFLAMACTRLNPPLKPYALQPPEQSINAPCNWVDVPEVDNLSAGQMRILLQKFAGALADCAERKLAVQNHYETQGQRINEALQ